MPNNSRFTVYSMGFFLYPYRSSRDGSTLVPVVAAPHAPRHLAAVMIKQGQGKWERHGGKPPYDIRFGPGAGREAQPNSGHEAVVKRARFINGLPPGRGGSHNLLSSDDTRWENFDLIPDLGLMSSGVTLRPDWRCGDSGERPDIVMDCIGGELTAIPDGFTTKEKWRWSSGHRQVVSGLCRYRPQAAGAMWLNDKKIVVNTKTTVVLFNIADRDNETDYQRYVRGLDHHVAILRLCEPESRVSLESPLDSEPTGIAGALSTEYSREYRQVVVPAKRALYASMGARLSDARVLEGGYPSCMGRKMSI